MAHNTQRNEKRRPHRGAVGDMPAFAARFLKGRMEGFSKDMRICLTGVSVQGQLESTHAYFPALAACCATLEYLAGLHVGRLERLGKREVVEYALAFLDQPDYDQESIRLLFDAFRNPVAHRGIASGVWKDNHDNHKGRRVTWNIHADTKRPALTLMPQSGVIKYDSPWECSYTHRMHIRLGRLWRDIESSVDRYIAAIQVDAVLQRNFSNCMRALYPPD